MVSALPGVTVALAVAPGVSGVLVAGESALGSWGNSKERDLRPLPASQRGKDD